MPRNGSGTYSLPAGNPVVTGTTISSTTQNTTMTDVQNALTTSIASDGQTTPTANLPMGGFKHTGQGAGTTTGDSVRWEQLFSQGAEQTLVSAATTDIGAQNTSFLQITGTTTITSFGINYNGPRWLRFAASLAIVNSATLVCPVPGSNLNVAAGDVVVARPILGGGWIVDLIMSPAQLIAQRWIAFTTAGTAPAFTLAPTIPLLSYAAGQRFNVTFNAAGTAGSNTLNVSGLGVQNLKQYDGGGVKYPAVVLSGMVSDVEYDGTDFIVLNPVAQAQIQSVSASVAANALTLGFAGGPLSFRSATLASGTPNTRAVPTLSLVVPSGATLGTVSGVQSRLYALVLDVSPGVQELAVVNAAGGNDLSETGLISTTAISAAATAANVVYSTTARTNVPYRVVEYVESTQAVAGTWATAPSTVQGYGGQALATMSGFGFGQTEQTVTRNLDATYYNTTGKTIFLSVTYTQNGGVIILTVNGTVAAQSGGSSGQGFLCFPIRPWASYVLSVSGTNTIAGARELR